MGQANCCSRTAVNFVTQPERVYHHHQIQPVHNQMNATKEVSHQISKAGSQRKLVKDECHANNSPLQSLPSASIFPNIKESEMRSQANLLPPIDVSSKTKKLYRNHTVELAPALKIHDLHGDIQKQNNRPKRAIGTLVVQSPAGRRPSLIKLPSNSQVSLEGRSIVERVCHKQDIFANLKSQQRKAGKTSTFCRPVTSERGPDLQNSLLTLQKTSSRHCEGEANGDMSPTKSHAHGERLTRKRPTYSSLVSFQPGCEPSKPILRKAESTILPSTVAGSKFQGKFSREQTNTIQPIGSPNRIGLNSSPKFFSESGQDSNPIQQTIDELPRVIHKTSVKKVTFKFRDQDILTKVQAFSGKDLRKQTENQASLETSQIRPTHQFNLLREKRNRLKLELKKSQEGIEDNLPNNKESSNKIQPSLAFQYPLREQESPIDLQSQQCLSGKSSPSNKSLFNDMQSIGLSP